MIGIINSLNGLVIGTIICFFAFALQNFQQGALFIGIASLLILGIKALIISLPVKERNNAMWSPSHSQRVKNRRIKMRAA